VGLDGPVNMHLCVPCMPWLISREELNPQSQVVASELLAGGGATTVQLVYQRLLVATFVHGAN
jgi:hypothetical protein